MDFLLQPPPFRLRRRGDNPEGYVTPPLDGSLTVSELYDFHYKENPEYPVFVYADQSGLTRLTFRGVVPASYNAARFIARVVGLDLQDADHPRPTVGILAMTDTITYFTTLLGMLRAEITFFVISPRNSAAAVAHLLTKVQTSHLFVSSEPPVQELATNALRLLNSDVLQMSVMPTYQDIFGTHADHMPLPPRRKDYSAPRVIVHSSGSTSFPKPVIWNDRSQLQVSLVPLYGAHDFCGQVFGCHAITMFHGIGLNFIPWLASTGLILATFPPATPAVTSTQDAIWSGFLATNPSYIFSPPVFVENWSREPSKLPFLKQSKGTIYGGAPLSKAVGDYLAGEGVAIYTLYGSSEVGPYCTLFPEHPGLDWEYFEINPQCATEFVPLGDGTYELVIVARPTTELTVLNSTFNGKPAYETSDYLAPHPTKSGRWKVLGRLDDQIILSSGEKTNPGPLENVLCQHPHVSSALIFGHGKFQNGALIELKKEYYFDPSNVDKLNEFRNTMQPQVEAMNAAAPTHSRLFKEMIIVSHASKPFLLNSKGFPRRTVILSSYNDEIETLYAHVEKGTNITIPSKWTPETSLIFVRSVVNGILKAPAEDIDDIFDKGCDSLQAMWIRQHVTQALASTKRPDVTSSLVYDHPNITSLADYIISVNQSDGETTETSGLRTDLDFFLAPYISNFPVWGNIGALQPKTPDVILVTGTTGALGTAVLAKLVTSDFVAGIYAFNRPSDGPNLLQRQKDALASRGYDPQIAESPKVTLVEGTLTREGLQIDSSIVDEIRTNITHILHIAWRVDFNLSLISYRKSLDGVRALVDLALSSPNASPPRLIFISSVGIFRNHIPKEPILEAPIDDPIVAVGSGYSESKWVAERILYEAAKHTPLQPIIVRVGQISGGINGSWNPSDWVPALVKSSLKVGFLPDIRGTCSWVPLDFTAEALVELRSADLTNLTAHLVHPKPVSSSEIFRAIGKIVQLPLRPYAEWVEQLGGLAGSPDADLSSIPAAKILDFFKEAIPKESDERDAMGVPILDTRQTLSASQALRERSSNYMLETAEVAKWLRFWQTVGFLPATVDLGRGT